MKIAISNLAWDHDEDDEVSLILKEYQIRGIEVAPTKVWTSPTETSDKQLSLYKKYWLDRGITIIATTSLLFNHPELSIFATKQTRAKTLAYLLEMIRLSASLGAKAMVFGSPKNRKTNNFPQSDVFKIASDFFWQIGEYAKKYNIYFGLEPNPAIYGTDFINTTRQAITLIKKINHPFFRLHMDSGTMAINKENYAEIIKLGLPYTCHFHISEPMLKPIPQNLVDHQTIVSTLRALNYDKWVSVEMPLGEDLSHPETIEQTLQYITKVYDSNP